MPHFILLTLFALGLVAAAFNLVRLGLDIRRNRAFTDDASMKGPAHDDVRLYVLLIAQARDLDRSWERVTDRADALWSSFTSAQREAARRQLEELNVPQLNDVKGGAR